MDQSPQAPLLTVTFWGAAQSVTGSMHLVELGGQRILLDCGVMRGLHGVRPHDRHFPFDPASLHAVVLSHAHVDHCGNLPSLVRHGFSGSIYCSAATQELLALILGGSARFHEEEALVQRILARPGQPEPEPRFTGPDVDRAAAQCVSVPYDEPVSLAPGITLRLAQAGHILGAAMIHLTLSEHGHTASVTFTGDLGRRNAPLLRDPGSVPDADLVVMESTYGGRTLEPLQTAVQALEAIVRRTVEREGKVLIPAFSLGRTQVVVDALQRARVAGRIPDIPVYVDSPVAAAIAAVYRRHPECLDEPSARLLREGGGFLDGSSVRYIPTQEESREVSQRPGPSVILAPSGMCDGGRIVHHLKQHIDDPRASVVLVNYQAPHTLGRRLLERGPTVRIHGRNWNKWADVTYLDGFSGHADHDDLLALVAPLAGRPCKVRVVHGEPEQAEALAGALRERGFRDVGIPERGETVAVP
jgi:metallo-beta-lactamase family protein